jgi:hypothetical protein
MKEEFSDILPAAPHVNPGTSDDSRAIQSSSPPAPAKERQNFFERLVEDFILLTFLVSHALGIDCLECPDPFWCL